MDINNNSSSTAAAPSSESIHEAAHAIAAAFMGIENIRITMDGVKPKCDFWGENGKVDALLVAGYAGYWADLNLSGLSEENAGKRATTDFDNFERTLRAFVPSDEEWQRKVKHFGNDSERLVLEYKETIFELAGIIEERRAISKQEVELLDCIKRVRAAGRKKRENASA